MLCFPLIYNANLQRKFHFLILSDTWAQCLWRERPLTRFGTHRAMDTHLSQQLSDISLSFSLISLPTPLLSNYSYSEKQIRNKGCLTHGPGSEEALHWIRGGSEFIPDTQGACHFHRHNTHMTQVLSLLLYLVLTPHEWEHLLLVMGEVRPLCVSALSPSLAPGHCLH